jgi:hypothetical protein
MKTALLLGLRRSAVIEVGLYLATALAVDQLFFAGERFRTVSPHPFWPVVLLIAAQYGTSEALFAAVAASLGLLVGNIPPQSITQDTYGYVTTVIREPIMWFAAAIVMGEIRVRHIRARDALVRDLTEGAEREQQLRQSYDRVSELKDSLEARVAGQLRTAISMYQAARGLDKQDRRELLLGAMAVVRAVMNPQKFSLYLMRDGKLEVSTTEGWTADDRATRVFNADSRLFQEVIGRQRIVCVSSRQDEPVLMHDGVLAGPLMDAETGDVLGMLKIEKLGFFDLHFSNIETFRVLCEWIGQAYVNARIAEQERSDSFFNPSVRLFSYVFFERLIEYLTHLARRIGFNLTLLLLRVDNARELTDERRRELPALVNATVLEVLRSTDLAFDYRRGGHHFCILLPKMSDVHVHGVADRIVSYLGTLAPDVRFSYIVQVIERGDAPAPAHEELAEARP